MHHGDTHYTSNSGTIELRRSLNGYLQRRYGIEYDPETELLITVGVSEALYLALTAILDPGDEVIVPQPCFVAYTAEVTLAGGVPVPIATRVENNFQVTREEIEAKITPRTKAILIGYPNNPTGAVMSRERLLDIAQLAGEARSASSSRTRSTIGWCTPRWRMARNCSTRASPRCPACAIARSCWAASPSRTR